MELQHVNVKIPVEGPLPIDPERFIEVFHRWTAEQSREELLIDVADYRHVPDGPGVMLIGHEADYSMDHTDGVWGLLYNRKTAVEGDDRQRLLQALNAAAAACHALEEEFRASGPLEFSRQRLIVLINDRALAPNTPETMESGRADLESALRQFLGHDEYTINREPDPRRRFAVTVDCSAPFELPVTA
jgi:hypothetical protein